MFTYANHLGLYSEEIGLTGEQLLEPWIGHEATA